MKLLFTLLSALLLVAGTAAKEDGYAEDRQLRRKQPRARGQQQRDLQFYRSERPNLGNGRLFARNGMINKGGGESEEGKGGNKGEGKGGSCSADADAISMRLEDAETLTLCIGTGKGYCGEVRVLLDPETEACDGMDEMEKVVDVGENCDGGDDDDDDMGDDDDDDDVGECPAGECRNRGGNCVAEGPACAPTGDDDDDDDMGDDDDDDDVGECPAGECRNRGGNCIIAPSPACVEEAVAEVEAVASASVVSCGVNEIYENGVCVCIPGAHKMGGPTCQCVVAGTVPNALGNQCVLRSSPPPPQAIDQMP